jgi:hypothetical protein
MKKQFFPVALSLLGLASLNAQTVTQVNYSTGGTNVPGYTQFFQNFNVTDTLDPLDGPFWDGQDGWTQSGDGFADAVGVYLYTPSAGNASGSLGIVFAPETTSSIVERSFTATDPSLFINSITVRYVAEWSVLDLEETAVTAFRFTLTDNLGSNGLQFDLFDDGALPPGFDYRLQANSANEFALNYNSLYRMQIDITGTSWSGELFAISNPSTTRDMVLVGSFDGGSLSGALSASDLNLLGVAMFVDNTDDLNALGMIVNEITVTSTGEPIPEPGTWAVGALLVGGIAASIYRRRKAALADTQA